MNLHYYDFIGIFGVGIIVITYFLLQIEKLSSTSLKYSVLNIIGSSFIIFSLYFNWNMASFIIEFFWILISLYGVFRYFKNEKEKEF